MSTTPSDVCAVCEQSIRTSRVRSNGRVFHEDCFVCSNCNISLDSCFFKNGKLYCDDCETLIFAKRCDKCKLAIQSTVVTARGRNFHNACFTCECCTSLLKGSFFYVNGGFICDSCDLKGYQPGRDYVPSQQTQQPMQQVVQAVEQLHIQQPQVIQQQQQQPLQVIQQQPQVVQQQQQPVYVQQNYSSAASTPPMTSQVSIISGSISPIGTFTQQSSQPNIQQQQQQMSQPVLQQQPSQPLVQQGSPTLQSNTFDLRNNVEIPSANIVLSQVPSNSTNVIYVVGGNPNLPQFSHQTQQQSQPVIQTPQIVTPPSPPPQAHNHTHTLLGELPSQYRGSGSYPFVQQPIPHPTTPQRNTGDFLQQVNNNPGQQLPMRQTGDTLQPNGLPYQRNTGDFVPNYSNGTPSSSGQSSPQLAGSTGMLPPTTATTSLKLSHDPKTEKFIPKIHGKTLNELLKYNSFDEILNDILKNKIQVHNHIPKEEVEFGDVMAAGASGKVYRGRWRGIDVAIKVYSADNFCFSREEFDREVSIMSLLDHECFVNFYGANCENPKYLFHLTELVKGGSLRDTLLNKQITLTYAQQVSIATDIASAMKYLHSLGVIHRDLKSGNVLISQDNGLLRGKVIDFGTSRAIDLAKQMTLNLGTSCWMAPEVFRNEPYTELCDVYSYGIVLWEIFNRKEPYEGVNSFTIPIMVTKGERPPIPSECPSDYSKLMKACWEDKPKKRPKFKEIHSTLSKILNNLTITKKKGFFK